MKKQFIEELPLLLNAASVTLLAVGTDLSPVSKVGLLILAGVTFIWYSHNIEKKYKK